MFPIRDHNPSHSAAYVTWALIAANLAVFVASMPWGGDIGMFWQSWPLYPGAVTSGHMLSGLVTHMFLHAGIAHVAGNMLFLWIFGDNLEDALGHIGFALFYLAAGLAAAAAQILAAPDSMVPVVGASGAIAGVMGGYLLLFPRARVDVLFIFGIFFRVLPVPAWLVLGVWFLIQIFSGSLAGAADMGVAYWAHAGGFAMGVMLTLPAWGCGAAAPASGRVPTATRTMPPPATPLAYPLFPGGVDAARNPDPPSPHLPLRRGRNTGDAERRVEHRAAL